MVVQFELPIKVLSINAASCRDARFKSTAWKDYAQAVGYHLDQIKELQEMAADFKAQGGTFKVEMIAYYPLSAYYNKDKTISSKTVDITNGEKPLIDLIFGACMDVNDKHIIEMVSKKP